MHFGIKLQTIVKVYLDNFDHASFSGKESNFVILALSLGVVNIEYPVNLLLYWNQVGTL